MRKKINSTIDQIISNDEVEFSIFCIENIIDKLGASGEKIYVVGSEKV